MNATLPHLTANTSVQKTRIHEIDALRGFAIVSVVILHWIVQPLSPLLSQLGIREVLTLLAYGVDLFFVISGFLIGGILLTASKKISGIYSFYIRRILRIWPLYYLLLFLVYLFSQAGRGFFEIPYWSFPIFVFNFWESVGYKLHQGLGPLWSIASEEPFYAVGPLVFFLIGRRQLKHLALIYVFFSPFLRLAFMRFTEIDAWRFTFTRLDGICVGILLSILMSNPEFVKKVSSKLKGLKIATLLLFMASVIFKVILPRDLWFSFGNSLVVLAFGSLLLTVQTQCALNQSIPILNLAFLRYLGLRCYSIYLFHIFFMLMANAITGNFFIGLLLQSVLTVGFAHFSWRHLEMPLIKLGQKFPYK
jgi:peptidoglycan/LPS O-acetylase OafA/YrhL